MKLNVKRTREHMKKRGAVLLIALLISGVALTVGAGVYSRVYKELIFSAFWKQAQIAFSVADAGLECAVYWDRTQAAAASCFGVSIAGWVPNANLPVASFNNIPVANGCVDVVIKKEGVAPVVTTVESRGHSTCNLNSMYVVERGVGVSY